MRDVGGKEDADVHRWDGRVWIGDDWSSRWGCVSSDLLLLLSMGVKWSLVFLDQDRGTQGTQKKQALEQTAAEV